MSNFSNKTLPIGEAADYLGVSEQTLRRWDSDGTFKASLVSAGGHRYYYLSDLERRTKGLFQIAAEWVSSVDSYEPNSEFYCSTSDRFKIRLERMAHEMERSPHPKEMDSLVTLVAGEVGNNSFDHNLGNWPDVVGAFYAYDLGKRQLVLADRGRGVLATLHGVRPEIRDEAEALQVAFTEIVTGRAPEHRGNGLKSVMDAVNMLEGTLRFQSGDAELTIDGRRGTHEIKNASQPIHGCRCLLEFR